MDSIQDYAIFVLDPEGRVASWSLGAERIKGYRAEEIIGQHFSRFYPQEDIAAGKPERALDKAREHGRVEDEGWRIRNDGSRFWANVVITALRDDDGQLRGFGKVTRDLTARRAAEQEVREAEQRFRQFVDGVTDYALCMLDASGHVVSWNAGARRIKGYKTAEIIGRHVSVLYTPEDRAAGKPERVLDSVRREGRFEEEAWRVRKDGTRIWANVVITALKNQADELIGFAKVTRDLSERREAREELRRAEERFQLLVAGVSDYAIYMLDSRGRVTTWNSGAERMKGYRASEIIGRSFEVFFPEAAVREGKPAHELAVAEKEGRFEDNDWRVRKDGARFWANVILAPLRDDSGKLLGFAKITRDLTAQRQAAETERSLLMEQAARFEAERSERRLRESEQAAQAAANRAELAAQRAEEASRVKDEFLATVSHELRTPLNAILGWASLLRDQLAVVRHGTDDKLVRGLDTIYRNAQAQARIVEDILDVSRIVTGKLRLELGELDLLPIVMGALDVVRPSASAKGITLELQPGNERALVVGDPERLRQVVWNLLSNAVKFTGAEGRIEVSVGLSGPEVVVTVRDTGQGIEPEFLPHVFERFQQADGSITRRYGGLGLGLAIVRHIVELHGGQVHAESAGLGRGSTFTVTLPACGSSPQRG